MSSTDPHSPAGLKALARLARLELGPAQEAQLGAHLQRILGWVAQLEQVPTEGVSASTPGEPLGADALRADRVGPSLTRADALRNAPAHDPLGFLVPRVVSE